MFKKIGFLRISIFFILCVFLRALPCFAIHSNNGAFINNSGECQVNRLPKIVVKPIDLDRNIKLVMCFISSSFTKNNKTLPFAEYICKLFPEPVGKINDSMNYNELRKVVHPLLAIN